MRTSDNESVFQIIKNSLGRPEKSNCILPLDVIKDGLEKHIIDVISTTPLLLVEKKKKFSQLYYFFDEDFRSMEMDFEKISDKLEKYGSLYADIVTKNGFEYKASFFQKTGLLPFKTYLRKNVINQHKKYRELMETEYADLTDSEEIHELLQSSFDVMSDHIPEKNELDGLIVEKNVLKIDVQDKIAGVLLYEDTGVKSYARALCVSPDFKGGAVGYSLLARYFNQHSEDRTKLFYLWVDEKNKSVKKLHDRFGYREDGLKDYIFKKGN